MDNVRESAKAMDRAIEMIQGRPPVMENPRIRERSDRWIDCPQTRLGPPIQIRPGTDDGDVRLLIHGRDRDGQQTGFMVEVRASDLREALDQAEVL